MVYKKYVTRKGKRHGPYYYESVRQPNGKIKAVYLGTEPPSERKIRKKKSVALRTGAPEHRGAGARKRGRTPKFRVPKVPSFDIGLTVHPKLLILLALVVVLSFGAYLGADYYDHVTATTGFSLVPFELEGQCSVGLELYQSPAEIGKPVQWVQKVNLLVKSECELSGEAPEGAENIEYSRDKPLVTGFITSEEPVETYRIKYTTPAPQKFEEEPVEDENKWVKKVVVSSDASVHYRNVKSFTTIPETRPEKVQLFHKIEGKRVGMTTRSKYNVKKIDTNGNGLIDRLEWNVPQLSEQEFEIVIDLRILNVQSYPELGGNWTVGFNTTGTADLNITKDEITQEHLTFVHLKCGDEIVEPVIQGPSVFVENWNCDDQIAEIEHIVEVAGKHSQYFQFGDAEAWAFNAMAFTWATVLVDTSLTIGTSTDLAVSDLDDSIHISYWDSSINANLLYANCTSSCETAGNWDKTTILATDDVGEYSSITTSSDEFVHIRYYKSTDGFLWYGQCDSSVGVDCSNNLNWAFVVVDDTDSSGLYSSGKAIATSSADQVVQVYHYHDSVTGFQSLRYAYCPSGLASCSNANNWQKGIIKAGVDVPTTRKEGYWASIALDSNDYAHVSSYSEANAYDLRYSFCDAMLDVCAAGAGEWDSILIDITADVGMYSSIAISPEDDSVHIAYRDATNTALKYANCTTGCTAVVNWDNVAVDSDGNTSWYPTIVVDTAGDVHIAYYNDTDEVDASHDLVYANCSASCDLAASWEITVVDSTNVVGLTPGIDVDSRNNIHISYQEDTNDELQYAQLYGNYAPTQGTPDLNSTPGTNRSADNLTCYNVSTFDKNNEDVTNIYNWYMNDTPIMKLYFPFDNNTNSTAADAIHDYSSSGNDGTLNLWSGPIAPTGVTDEEGCGVEATILGAIDTDEGVWNANWVVCACPTYDSGTPLRVDYDISAYAYDNVGAATLEVETDISGGAATMDITCGGATHDDYFLTGCSGGNCDDWLPPDLGITTLTIPTACFEDDTFTVKWARVGGNCLKFDYMFLNISAGYAWTPSGRVGGSYDFDGVSGNTGDYIDLGDQDNLIGQDYTTEFWVNTDDIVGLEALISKINAPAYTAGILILKNGAALQAYTDGGTTDCSDADFLIADTWIHAAIVFDGTSQCRIYRNGVLADTGTTDYNGVTDNNDNFFIGKNNDRTDRNFDGEIDELKIYNRVLSIEQIEANYLTTKDGYSDNSTIVSQETTANDAWTCEITPNDNNLDGTATNSTDLTINRIPTHSTPDINSSSGTNLTDENLTCYNLSTADPDGDAMTNNFNWYVNATPLMNLSLSFDSKASCGANCAKDYSGRGNNGTLGSSVLDDIAEPDWTSAGKVGGAYTFDGSDDYILVDNEDNFDALSTEFTVEGWFKTDETNPDRRIIVAKGGTALNYQWDVEISTNHKLSAHFFTTGGTSIFAKESTAAVNNGAWHHFVVVYDTRVATEDLTFYLDGSEETTILADTRAVNDYGNGNDPMMIGARGDDGSQELYFEGQIDEIRVYDRNVTTAQLVALYEDSDNNYDNRTIVAEQTRVGDWWECRVTPNDGKEDGLGINSSNLTVLKAGLACGETITADTTMTEDLTGCAGDGLIIGAGSIILDCAGYKIDGDDSGGGNGVDIDNEAWDGVTIKNCNITDFLFGIYVNDADDTVIVFNNLSSNINTGLKLDSASTSNIVGNNTIYENVGDGMYVFTSNSNIIENNTVLRHTGVNGDGIQLDGSNINVVKNNTFGSNYNGIVLFNSDSNIIGNNTINGSVEDGMYIYGGSSSNTIGNNTVIGDGLADDGMYITGAGTITNTIHNNTVSGHSGVGDIGIMLESGADSNIVVNNTVDSNYYGILLSAVSSNDIFHNGITSSVWDGILITGTGTSNYFLNNTILGSANLAIEDATALGGGDVLEYENDYGNISWTDDDGTITATGNLGFDYNLSITENNLFLNSSAHPLLNRSATLTIYDTDQYITLFHRGPHKFREGENNRVKCTAGFGCDVVQNADTYIFTVSNFSNLTVNESNNAPTQGTPELNSTPGINRSADNLTCYNVSTADLDDDAVTNIYNWYMNDTPIMKLYFPFDNNTNSTAADEIKDYSANPNHGTLSGDTYWHSSGKISGSYYFDGTGDYLTVANEASFDFVSSEFTVAGWFLTSEINADRRVVIAKGGTALNYQWDIELQTNHKLTAYFAATDGSTMLGKESTGVVNDGAWHHFVAIYDTSVATEDITLYVDGVEQTTITFDARATKDYGNGDDPVMLAARGDAGAQGLHFEGRIDDIRIYSRNITKEQAHSLWLDTKNGFSDNSTIVPEMTTANDKWTCEITPVDTHQEGTAANATDLTINRIPTQGTPDLNSSSGTNTTNENITCYNLSTSDPDSDVVTNIYSWYVNATPLMVLNMPFDSKASCGADCTRDYSGSENNGTQFGDAAWYTPGQVGGAYDFPGDNDYIQVDHHASLDLGIEDFSIALWMKHASVNEGDTLLAKADGNPETVGKTGWRLDTRNNGKGLTLGMGDGINAVGKTVIVGNVSQDAWTHIVISFDRTNDIVLGYLNGSLDTTQAGWFGVVGSTDTAEDMRIGINSWNLLQDFTGQLDDVKIYKRALSANQAEQLFNNTVLGYSENQTIVSDETRVGDWWECRITPNDGKEDGLGINSSNLTVLKGNPACGEIITEDTTLVDDLTGCAADGLIIGAAAITLDCAGYKLFGNGAGGGDGVVIINEAWDGVTIKNCNISAFNDGILIVGGDDTVMEYNNVSECLSDGIYIGAASTGNTIQNHTIWDNTATGIYLDTSDTNIIKNNTIHTHSGVGEIGISLATNADSNVIVNNTLDTNYYGVYFSSSDSNTFGNNTVSSSVEDGIYLDTAALNTVSNNSVIGDGNGDDGIYLTASPLNTITNNTISGHSGANDVGLVLWTGSDSNDIINNTIDNNNNGINIFSADSNTMLNNSISNSGNHGIAINSGVSNIIGNNTVSSNSVDGIFLESSSDDTIIENNTISSNIDEGMFIEDSDDVIIRNNTVDSNSGNGIELSGTTDSTIIENNTIDNHAGASDKGIFLDTVTPDIVIQNNSLDSNYWGIYLSGSDSNLIGNNSITNNVYDGIYIFNSDWNTINNNTVSASVHDGIFVSSSHNNTVSNNTVAGDGNGNDGISLSNANYNNITLNTVTGHSGASDCGVYVASGANAYNNIRNNIIDSSVYGVSLSGGSRNTIENNTVTTSTITGLRLSGTTNNVIDDNRVIAGDNDGIALIASSTDNNITGNNVSDHSGPSDIGIYLLTDCDSNLVQNNTVYNNYYGLSLSTADSNTIRNNTILKSTYYGIYMTVADWNTIDNNTISNSVHTGMYLISGADNNTISNNTVQDNTEEGIYTSNCFYNNFTLNQITGHSGVTDRGIMLSVSDRNHVWNNTADNNYQGIFLNFADKNEVYENVITSSVNNGIHLSSADSNRITNNSVVSNGEDGIYLTSSASNTIENNTVTSNTDNGIELITATFNNISNNTITGHGGSGDAGIFLDTAADSNIIDNNTLTTNYMGIYIHGSDSNSIGNNSIYSNTYDGLYLSDADSNTLWNNTLTGDGLGDDGMYFTGSSHNIINTNRVTGHSGLSDVGISLSVSTDNNFTNNTIDSNLFGFMLGASSDFNWIVNNTISNNGDDGIYITGSASNSIINNSIHTNTDHGIRFSTATLSNISQNIIQTHTGVNDYGINFQAGSDSNIIYNNTLDNNYDAVYLISADSNIIGNNTVSNNDHNGISLTTSNSNIIDNNSIFSNGIHGIELSDSDSTSIFHNVIRLHNADAGDKGMYLATNSDSNVIFNNTFSTNDFGIYTASANSNSFFSNYITDSADTGLYVGAGSTLNYLLNNTILRSGSKSIDDNTGGGQGNSLAYENLFGNMSWTDTGATLAVAGQIGLGYNITLEVNDMFLNSSASALTELNRSATITIYNTDVLGFNNRAPYKFRDPEQDLIMCTVGHGCAEVADADTYIFTVSNFTNYSVGEDSTPTAPDPYMLDAVPQNTTITTNRRPVFLWNNSTDPDGGTLTYQIQIDDDPDFSDLEYDNASLYNDTEANQTSFTPFKELNFSTYSWRVRAFDSAVYSDWSVIWGFELQSSVAISMVNNTSNFTNDLGTFPKPGDNSNTSIPGVGWFVVENDGNCEINLTINGSDFWPTVPNPTSNYNFKTEPNVTGSYVEGTSSWTQVPVTSTADHVGWLLHNNITNLDKNRTDIYFNITVPVDYGAGQLSSTVWITGEES